MRKNANLLVTFLKMYNVSAMVNADIRLQLFPFGCLELHEQIKVAYEQNYDGLETSHTHTQKKQPKIYFDSCDPRSESPKHNAACTSAERRMNRCALLGLFLT